VTIVVLLLGLLPAHRIKNALLNLTGARIARSARIQPIVLWRVRSLVVGERGYIGPANSFRELARVELGEDAEIGQLNWFSAAASYLSPSDHPMTASLVMDDQAAIVSRHYVDCSGGVEMKRTSILGGVRSTVLSHSADVHAWEVTGSPVVFGERSMVLSHSLVSPGITIADGVVAAAGAVIVRDLPEPGRLYGGVPAKVIGDLSGSDVLSRETSRRTPRDTIRALKREQRARQ
jgi:acetyltransferase-like isoleucine patch superfamily enzyme